MRLNISRQDHDIHPRPVTTSATATLRKGKAKVHPRTGHEGTDEE